MAESRIRWWFARSIFPLVFGGSLMGAIALIDRGMSPVAAAPLCQAIAFLIVLGCERIIPLHRSWLHSNGDMKTDLSHALTVIGTGAIVQPALVAAGIAASSWFTTRAGFDLWPDQWPLLGQITLAVVVVEAFQYWVHRLQHTVDWMWRFHATHHSAPRLYWLNASRFHFGDILMHNVAGFIPLMAMGASEEMLALWTLFAAVHGVFQHANLPLRLGPLNWIFSMAELHRWHHSPRAEEANHNYGQNIILFDILFGTRFLPKDREPPEQIGIESLPTFPTTWWAQILSPLRWRKIEAASQQALAQERGNA
ncbi:sterol desaturase family protein [Myxococcota bacterium]|nr:sterol desaturase family protein [Myxococcota bacterium]